VRSFPTGTLSRPSSNASVLHIRQECLTVLVMKSLTIRLPDALVRKLEQESSARGLSKSDIVRERLAVLPSATEGHPLADILDEMDQSPKVGRTRDGATDKKRLSEIVRRRYHGAKRHFRQ
jgi:Ribbon-helix-helix protein, copG family.